MLSYNNCFQGVPLFYSPQVLFDFYDESIGYFQTGKYHQETSKQTLTYSL